MPSDDRAKSALDAMSGRAQAFRAAIAITASEIRAYLSQYGEVSGEKPTAAAVLGAFAEGRIDAARFSRLLAPAKPAASGGMAAMERALAVLDELEAQGDELLRVRVERGGDLIAGVERALAHAGRAFGAARVANLVRSNESGSAEKAVDENLSRFPFRRWSKAERDLAPPVVIEVAGGDTLVAGLAAYLDGNQGFVLLVEGQAPPAPLARLICPGVFVMQTNDVPSLRQVGAVAGPAVAAVMPAGSARFVHAPADGSGFGQLEVTQVPAQEPRRPLGSVSVFQQQQDLRLLAALRGAAKELAATRPSDGILSGTEVVPHEAGQGNGASPVAAAPTPDPVGTLASWLLARVDLSDLEADGF